MEVAELKKHLIEAFNAARTTDAFRTKNGFSDRIEKPNIGGVLPSFHVKYQTAEEYISFIESDLKWPKKLK